MKEDKTIESLKRAKYILESEILERIRGLEEEFCVQIDDIDLERWQLGSNEKTIRVSIDISIH